MHPEDCCLLLVDDEAANLDLLELILSSRGFHRLVRTTDPREVAGLVVREQPDLILLDLHMPHCSGFDLLEALEATRDPDEYRPVLVLTADMLPTTRERALAAGAHDFVLKPFDRTEVLLRARNLLRTRLLHMAQRDARYRAERAARRDRLLADASQIVSATSDAQMALPTLARLLEKHLAVPCASDGGADEGFDGMAGGSNLEVAPVVITLRIADDLEPLGHLRLRVPDGAPLDEEDMQAVTEVARRAALALSHARLTRELQLAVAARDEVLAIVAHDLRSPLSAMRFDLELLRLAPTRPHDSQDLPTLQRVERAAARMDRLIQDLLDVARLNRQPLAVVRRPLDMAVFLSGAVEMLRSVVEAEGGRLSVTGPAALPVMLVDESRLLQALANLVGNAVKFAAADAHVEIRWAVAPDELRIEICDNGPGISAEVLPHIFGAFWQGRHADRRGLGMGLAIALAVVEAHDGRLWVQSPAGEGATFVLTLPVNPSPLT